MRLGSGHFARIIMHIVYLCPLMYIDFLSGTKVHIFYALKMGEKYARRYARHFRNADIRKQSLEHEELLLCQPDAWVKEVKACVLGK